MPSKSMLKPKYLLKPGEVNQYQKMLRDVLQKVETRHCPECNKSVLCERTGIGSIYNGKDITEWICAHGHLFNETIRLR